MQRLQSILLKGRQSVVAAKARQQLHAFTFSGSSQGPIAAAAATTVAAFSSFTTTHQVPLPPQAFRCVGRLSPLPTSTKAPARPLHTNNSSSNGFLRAVRIPFTPAAPVAGSLRFTPFCVPHRNMSVRGKNTDGAKGDQENTENKESKEEEEAEAKTEESKKGEKHGKAKKQKKNSFADHVRGLKEDYMKFPDIYNSANGINFVIFTVFCLCSTGSNTEEKWWVEQWGLDNTFRPWNWLLHSFLTNNFLSMSYAMMLLHTLCHSMIPTLGSHGLLMYVVSTAVISGAIMWLGNLLYYGNKQAAEKQFGPWDVVHALFVMYYLQFAITPVAVLNSFNSWLKYAVWVGEICILYFDWQPTVVGTLVGFALCKGVPRFRVKPLA